MLSQIHILLTYGCTFECDHCFLYCSPRSKGTFTRARIAKVLDQACEMGGVEWIYFEGGEPFLYYPQMVEGLRMARDMGFATGVVTNGYWATSEEDAEIWLRPLAELDVADISFSDDALHGSSETAPVKMAIAAAEKMGLPLGVIRVDGEKVKFRGRAVDKLSAGLPRHPASHFGECPYEDLQSPDRVHVDSFGNVQVCQGLVIGNMWERPLARIFAEYDATTHAICAPLTEGGPARLAGLFGAPSDEGYVDACHLCFLTRRALLERYPDLLAPRQVYGLD
ncbi:MAG: radical SAM protein [Rhodospirillales bacterium]|nr:radical SAM protein [Rhodospirillales bacterium]